jgi:AP-4 complex subunit epsilon-1
MKRDSLQADRADLINLDSPFIADPDPVVHEEQDAASQSIDFESIWSNLDDSNSRGWCERSSDDVVRLLQKLQLKLRVISSDQPPFNGSISFVSFQNHERS